MKQHLYSHVEGVSYACNQCDKVIRSNTALKRHISIDHKKQPKQGTLCIPQTNLLNGQSKKEYSKQWLNVPINASQDIKKMDMSYV